MCRKLIWWVCWSGPSLWWAGNWMLSIWTLAKLLTRSHIGELAKWMIARRKESKDSYVRLFFFWLEAGGVLQGSVLSLSRLLFFVIYIIEINYNTVNIGKQICRRHQNRRYSEEWKRISKFATTSRSFGRWAKERQLYLTLKSVRCYTLVCQTEVGLTK